jgi:hypothetical protein
VAARLMGNPFGGFYLRSTLDKMLSMHVFFVSAFVPLFVDVRGAMGSWCTVRCRCLGAKVLPGSNWPDRPYYGKYPLTYEEADIVSEWDRSANVGMLTCGHKNGIFYEIWPGDIFQIGRCLAGVYDNQEDRFALFKRIGNTWDYIEEKLVLPPNCVQPWQSECLRLFDMMYTNQFIEELRLVTQRYLSESTLEGCWEEALRRKYHKIQSRWFDSFPPKHYHAVPFPFKPDQKEDFFEFDEEEERKMQFFIDFHMHDDRVDKTYPGLFRQILENEIYFGTVDACLFTCLSLCKASAVTNNAIIFAS